MFQIVDILCFVNAEIEFLEMLIKTCRAARDPKRKSRVEMAVPAAQWEMKFESRLAELHEAKTEPKPLAA